MRNAFITVIGLTAAITALAGTTLIIVGSMSALSGFIKVWPMMRNAAVMALRTIRTNALTSATALKGISLPVLGLVGLAGALYFAWRKNFAGIRDMVRAVTEGFKMAFSASKDGIAEVDEALAEELEKAGIWDFAVIMGKVFFRVRQLWEGVVEGFMTGFNQIKGFLKSIAKFFEPVVTGGQSLLKMLGLFAPIAETQSDKWRAWGTAIGQVVPYVLALITAFKGMSIATSIINNISRALGLITGHPIVAAVVVIIAMIAYLYTHWEAFADWFNGIISSFADIFGAVFRVIQGICQTVVGVLTLDWNKFVEGIKNIFGGIVDWFRGIVKTIIAIFAAPINWLMSKLQPVFNWIKNKWQSVIDWCNSWSIKDVFAPLSKYADKAKEYVQQKWEALQSWWGSWSVADIFAPVKGYADSAIESIKSAFPSISGWAEKYFKLDFNGMFEGLISSAQSVKDTFSNLGSTIKSLLTFDFSGAWDSLIASAESVKGIFKGIGESVMSIFNIDASGVIQGIKSIAGGIKEVITGIGETIIGLFTFDFSGIKDGLAKELSGVKEIFSGIGKYFASMFNIDLKGISSTINQIKAKGQAVIDWWNSWKFPDIFAPVKEYATSASQWAKDKWQSVSDWFNSLQLPNIFEGLSNFASSAIDSIKGLFSSFGKWIMDTIGSLNPFNWELPSWLGGGEANAAKRAEGQKKLQQWDPLSGNLPGYAAGGIVTQPHIAIVGEAGREAIVPLEDRSSGIPLLMSAINEMGLSSNDILPYIKAVNPETEQPIVNVPSVSPAPINIPELPEIRLLAGATAIPENEEMPNALRELNRTLASQAQAFTPAVPHNVQLQPNSQPQNPASPYLIQHSQNQAAMSGQAAVQAQAQNPERPVNVNNQVDVKIESKPVEVILDGEKIGSFNLRWLERQNVRSGTGGF